MNLMQAAKGRGPLTWFTLVAALSISVFYLDAIVQYWGAPIAQDPKSKDVIARSLFEHLSLLATNGESLIWAKLAQASLAAVGIASAILAALVMWRAPDNAAARQVAGLAVAYAVFGAAAYFVPWLPEYEGLRKALAANAIAKSASSVVLSSTLLVLAIGFARFLAIFPRPLDVQSVHQAYLARPLLFRWTGNQPVEKSTILPRWHAALVSGWVFWTIPILALLLAVDLMFDFKGKELFGLLTVVPMLVGILAYFFVGLPYAFASISHHYRFGDATEQRRVAWLRAMTLSGGLALIPVMLVLFISMATRQPALKAFEPIIGTMATNVIMVYAGAVFFLFIPAAILTLGVVAVRGGALDPRVAFTRVTLWSAVGLCVTITFVLVERLAAIKLVQWFNLPPDAGVIAAGALTAGTFVPVRNFASSHINRLAERWIPLETIAEGTRVEKMVIISDLSGYTALSGSDEPAALLQSAALRRQGERIVSRHGGTFVKSLGDAVMLTFADAKAALRATIELHQEFPKVMDAVGQKPLKLHSALHFGEFAEARDGDIFGQTVNITARLVDAAAAGEIVVSGDAKSRLDESDAYQNLGPKKFKNVPNAIQCYRWNLSNAIDPQPAPAT